MNRWVQWGASALVSFQTLFVQFPIDRWKVRDAALYHTPCVSGPKAQGDSIALTTTQRNVLNVICKACNHERRDGIAWLSYDRIALETGYWPRTCVEAVAALEARGWLIVRRRVRRENRARGEARSNLYRLAIPAHVCIDAMPAAGGSVDDERVAAPDIPSSVAPAPRRALSPPPAPARALERAAPSSTPASPAPTPGAPKAEGAPKKVDPASRAMILAVLNARAGELGPLAADPDFADRLARIGKVHDKPIAAVLAAIHQLADKVLEEPAMKPATDAETRSRLVGWVHSVDPRAAVALPAVGQRARADVEEPAVAPMSRDESVAAAREALARVRAMGRPPDG